MQILVWSMATWVWILDSEAVDSKRLNAFEMDMYRRMMRISWMEHRTSDSVLEELKPTCRFLAEVRRRKLQYFGRVVHADSSCKDMFYVVSNVEEDHRDDGQMMSNSGQHPLQSVFSVQETNIWRSMVSMSVTSDPVGSRIWDIDWYQNERLWPLFRGRIKVNHCVTFAVEYLGNC